MLCAGPSCSPTTPWCASRSPRRRATTAKSPLTAAKSRNFARSRPSAHTNLRCPGPHAHTNPHATLETSGRPPRSQDVPLSVPLYKPDRSRTPSRPCSIIQLPFPPASDLTRPNPQTQTGYNREWFVSIKNKLNWGGQVRHKLVPRVLFPAWYCFADMGGDRLGSGPVYSISPHRVHAASQRERSSSARSPLVSPRSSSNTTRSELN